MAPRFSTPLLLSSCLVSSQAASLLLRDAGASLKERPVMKVVRLLQDMKKELEFELADDKAVHEKLDCWCKENDRIKTQAIEVGEAKESELESFLGEAAAKMKQLKVKRDTNLDQVDKAFNSLNEARELRMKEVKEFHGSEADMLEAIKACEQAIVVLKEYHPDPANFAQVKAMAQNLQKAQVLELVKQSTSGPSEFQLQALQSFLADAQTGNSFLTIPGYQSYAPQSGQIFGILQQMKEDFEKDLSESQKKEKQAAEDFAAMKEAKEDEITSGRELVAKLDGEIADLKVKHAEAFKELEDTQAQLELDREFLGNLQKKCSESATEYDERVKARSEEIAAVADTIKILNSDEAFNNFDKTVNSFLQVSSNNVQQEALAQRTRAAAAVLTRAGTQFAAPALSLLASRMQIDTFTRVKKEIDKMVEQLSTQQKDEVMHRDWCLEELQTNKRGTEAAYDKKGNLQAKIADLEKSIEYLKKEIEATTQASAETQEQMKRASETREAESGDFQETVTDQRMTQIILKKAIARMSEVYSFFQRQPGAPHIQTSGNHTDPGNGPARFTKYEQKPSGSRVVNMLEEVLADSQKTEDDAIRSEEDSQTAYENFMKDSNKVLNGNNKKIVNMNGASAKAKEDLILANTDLKATMSDLEGLNSALGDLKGSCDFVLQNFEARQQARLAEIDALKEAKAILSGAK